MKITKKLLFIVLACLLILAPVCIASNNPLARNNQPVATSEDKNTTKKPTANIMNTDLYTGAQDVVINDTINGNAFAAGSTVTVKGEVFGDLFVLANTLVVEDSAVIHNSIFALGNTITVKGTANDVYAFGQSFDLTSSASIQRDAKLYVGIAKINGVIKRDAYLIASNITMPENAKNLIGGNLNYTASQEFSIPKAAVSGEVKYTPYEKSTPSTAEIVSSHITKFITTILYAIVVILLATYFAPKFIEKASYTLNKRPFVSAGIGILSIVLIPVIAIMLLMTGVLAYVSMAILAVYALALSITLPIFSMIAGKFIADKFKSTSKGKFILFSILSAIVLWLVQIIPFVGGYISMFIYVVGLGIFLFAFFMRKDVSEVGNKK